MTEKSCLESFVSDIDKIITGEPITSAAYEHCEEEYQELLALAQLLAKADYTTESKSASDKVAAKINSSSELEDDELDLVAGGVNLNSMEDEKGKKK
ncbi:MAG: hypothetical protein FH758_10800 [Firmicutes bacterium]|nr:hypothetical protein [Bacillota bacterium]